MEGCCEVDKVHGLSTPRLKFVCSGASEVSCFQQRALKNGLGPFRPMSSFYGVASIHSPLSLPAPVCRQQQVVCAHSVKLPPLQLSSKLFQHHKLPQSSIAGQNTHHRIAHVTGIPLSLHRHRPETEKQSLSKHRFVAFDKTTQRSRSCYAARIISAPLLALPAHKIAPPPSLPYPARLNHLSTRTQGASHGTRDHHSSGY